MSGFTKGPWVVYPETNGTEICAVTMVQGLPIRQLIARPVLGENWIANARLIASSPELYEALQMADEWIREAKNAGCALSAENTLRLIRTALSKATGEGV